MTGTTLPQHHPYVLNLIEQKQDICSSKFAFLYIYFLTFRYHVYHSSLILATVFSSNFNPLQPAKRKATELSPFPKSETTFSYFQYQLSFPIVVAYLLKMNQSKH
jgi:hypothetical protein